MSIWDQFDDFDLNVHRIPNPHRSTEVQRLSETVLHGSVSGRSEPTLVWVQAMRTDSGRPSFNMRFRTATPTFISVA